MTDSQFSSSRRDLMKAIGAGTALTAFGTTTVAGATREADVATLQEQDDDSGDDQSGGESGGTVHVVQTLIGPSTNDQRPADFFYQPTGLHVQPGDVIKFVFATPDHNVVSYHPAFGMRRRMPTGLDPVSAPVSGFKPSSIPGDMIDPPALPEMGESSGEGSDDTGDDGSETDDAGENGGGASGDDAVMPVPDTFLLGLETPGVYDLLCSPHEHFGMAMRVVVGDETETQFETSNPGNLPEPRTGPVGLARVTLTDAALQPSNIVERGAVRWQDLESVGGSGGAGGGGGDGGDAGGESDDDDGDDNGNDDDGNDNNGDDDGGDNDNGDDNN